MMGIDKSKVRKHFDRHARDYDEFAVVQKVMADHLLKLAMDRKAPANVKQILEIGCGTGGLTGSLLTAYPQARITAIDLSSQMAVLTNERYGAAADHRLEVLVGDAELLAATDTWESTEKIDLMISNATFQWFNDPLTTANQLLNHLAPGGVLAIGTFGPRTFKELHEAFYTAETRLGLHPLRHGQYFAGLEDWESAFAGQAAFYVEEADFVETFADVFSFLHRVKRIGAGNANQEAGGMVIGGRRLFAEMEKVYRECFSVEGGVQATYHLIFGLVEPAPVWRTHPI